MTSKTYWRGALGALVITLAACGGIDNATPPTAVLQPTTAATAPEPLAKAPVTVARGADGKCDWASVDLAPANALAERFRGSKAILRLEHDAATCTGNFAVRPVDLTFLSKAKTEVLRPADFRSKDPTAQAYEQTRSYCLSLITSQGTKASYRTAQGMTYSDVPYTQFGTYFEMTAFVARANVGGNYGMNCVRLDSLRIVAYADSIHFWKSEDPTYPFNDPNLPYQFGVTNQAPGGPFGTLQNAWCAGGTCLASLYIGAYRGFYNWCPWIWEGESRTFSNFNGTTWPDYYYIHARTDGILQVAGWGGPAHGFPGTFTTCAQGSGPSVNMAYSVWLA